MSFNWQASAATNCGHHRRENLDNHYISLDQRLFVVADGMGANGAMASKLAVEAITASFAENIPDASDTSCIQQWLAEAISCANQVVYAHNKSVNGRDASTIVVGVRGDLGQVHIAHVGDSRAYRIRGDHVVALTQDHRVSAEMVRRGILTTKQLNEGQCCKDFLTRAVGHTEDIDIDQSTILLESGDWLLLCTDGLFCVLSEEQIAKVLTEANGPTDACRELIEQTLAGGAPDDVTVVCASYA